MGPYITRCSHSSCRVFQVNGLNPEPYPGRAWLAASRTVIVEIQNNMKAPAGACRLRSLQWS